MNNDHNKLRLLRRSLTVALLLFCSSCIAQSPQCQKWPSWAAFKQNLLTEDGRVVDSASEFLYTTSEGQSYGLFFALVANDKKRFETLLKWTENNLAGGDLTARLPAWQWGKRKDDSWGVVDDNSASDSDLWIAYALLEAGRLWHSDRYTALGKLLAQRILREETAQIPGLGLTLLPAPIGFHPDEKTWRLNPSYAPIQILRALYRYSQNPKWLAVIKSSQQLIIEGSPKGFVPDWINYQTDKGFEHSGQFTSYNAIRSYLWAGMMAKDEPLRQAQLLQFKPMVDLLAKQGVPMEKIDINTAKAANVGSSGFSAALLPFLYASNATAQLEQQQLRLIAHPLSDIPKHYYDQMLGLFGVAWMNKRFEFDREGRLITNWDTLCP